MSNSEYEQVDRHLSFSLSATPEAAAFDSSSVENHWEGSKVEFFVPSGMKAQRKYLKLTLKDNQQIENPVLSDGD